MKLPTNGKNLIKSPKEYAPTGVYMPKFLVTFSVLGLTHPPLHRSSVDSCTPNFTPIGATCHPCGVINLKIAPWVTEIPALCAARNAAGKNRSPKTRTISQSPCSPPTVMGNSNLGSAASRCGRACSVWRRACDRACQFPVWLGCVVRSPVARCRGSRKPNSIDSWHPWNREVQSPSTAEGWTSDLGRDYVWSQSTVYQRRL